MVEIFSTAALFKLFMRACQARFTKNIEDIEQLRAIPENRCPLTRTNAL